MLEIAPRLPPRLLDEIERLSRRQVPIAEINRRVGAQAARMSLPKPSYERVRVLVHAARALRRAGPQSVSTLALDVAFRVKPATAFVDRLGEGPRLRLRDRASPGK